MHLEDLFNLFKGSFFCENKSNLKISLLAMVPRPINFLHIIYINKKTQFFASQTPDFSKIGFLCPVVVFKSSNMRLICNNYALN